MFELVVMGLSRLFQDHPAFAAVLTVLALLATLHLVLINVWSVLHLVLAGIVGAMFGAFLPFLLAAENPAADLQSVVLSPFITIPCFAILAVLLLAVIELAVLYGKRWRARPVTHVPKP
jgi:hypothetical protein